MEHFKSRWRYYLYVALAISLLILLYCLCQQSGSQAILLVDQTTQSEVTKLLNESESLVESLPVDSTTNFIYVDIKGAVKRPGVYHFEAGSRVVDAIEAAGGLQTNAAVYAVNQAQLLEDQMAIIILTEDEYALQVSQSVPGLISGQLESSTQEQASLININTADVIALQSLPGIGPKKAQQIIDYRNENGSFQTVEDLKQVKGIGEKIFEQVQALICVQ